MPEFNQNKNINHDLSFQDIINIFQTIVDKSMGTIASLQLGGITELDLDKLGLDKLPCLYLEPTGSVVNNYEKTFDFDVAILSSVYYQKHVGYQNLDEESQLALNHQNKSSNPAQTLAITNHEMHYNVLNSTNASMMFVIKQFVQNLIERSWVNETASLDMPVNLTPINTEYDNMLVGWAGSFTVRVNNRNALCGDDLAIVQS